MKLLVGVMGFAILVCAALTMHNSGAGAAGTAAARPSRRQRHLRAVADRRRRRVDHDALLQLLDARRGHAAAPGISRYVRGDVAIAYVFTAIFGMSIMLIANEAFFVPAVKLRDAQAVPKMAAMLGRSSGRSASSPTGRLLGRGVRVAARRVAERAVSLCRLLRV